MRPVQNRLSLPCEKCGKLIDYNGVSENGQTCPSCGAERPHTLKGNPLLPFLFFFGGWLIFALANPFGWDDDLMILPAFGSLLLLVWFKVFLPTHIEMRRTKNSMTDTRGEAKGGKYLDASQSLSFWEAFCRFWCFLRLVRCRRRFMLTILAGFSSPGVLYFLTLQDCPSSP